MQFDERIDRINTSSWKWDNAWREFSDPGEQEAARKAIPMWIADMDFRAPQPVIDTLRDIASFGVYGYTFKNTNYYESLRGWLSRRHGWEVEREWIDFSPGVLPGIAACVRAFTEPGAKIIIQPPVYYPFADIVRMNGRTLLENPLKEENMVYTMDYDDLEAKARDPEARMLILCSPHNPVGRVWHRDELSRLCEICAQNGVIIVSDEIHADLVLHGHSHIPLAVAAPEALALGVQFYAPSKTFNLAGLQTAAVIIARENMRLAYREELRKSMIYSGSVFGLAAFQAAYDRGEAYLDELLIYLEGNYDYLKAALERVPGARVAPLEGTYLAWIDMTGCGIPRDEVNNFVLTEGGIVADFGDWFSRDYMGYIRINLACPKSLLKEACGRLCDAVAKRQALL